jgi:uncharacterized protein (DUF736 family)
MRSRTVRIAIKRSAGALSPSADHWSGHAMKLDDPFPVPIYANLVALDEGYALVWSR